MEQKDLFAIEREILESVDGVCEKAESAYLKRLKADHDLQAIFNRVAVHDRIRLTTASDRRLILRRDPNPDRGADFLANASKRCRRMLMDLPLLGGLRLRNARWSDLDGEIDIRQKLAHGNAVQAKFLESIRKALPDGSKQVGEVLTENDLAKLLGRAEKIR